VLESQLLLKADLKLYLITAKNWKMETIKEKIKKIMFLESKVRLVRGADNLTAIYEPII
jgi:hypothetical protein